MTAIGHATHETFALALLTDKCQKAAGARVIQRAVRRYKTRKQVMGLFMSTDGADDHV